MNFCTWRSPNWVLVLLGATVIAAPIPQPSAVGIIMRVQGSVGIEELGSRPRTGELGTPLYTGSKLRVQGAATVLFCPTRSLMDLRDGVFQIGATGVNAESGSVSAPRGVRFCSVPTFTAGMDSTRLIGGTITRDLEKELILVSPLQLHKVSARPEFYWRQFPEATSYKLELRDPFTGAAVWQRDKVATGIAYSGLSRLPSGRYEWRVTALRQTEILASASTTFDVLSRPAQDAQEAAEREIQQWVGAQPNDPTPWILLGLHLEGAGFMRRAVEAYRRSNTLEPNDAIRARLRELEVALSN